MQAVVAVVFAVLSVGLLWYAWREISAMPRDSSTSSSSRLKETIRPEDGGRRDPMEEGRARKPVPEADEPGDEPAFESDEPGGVPTPGAEAGEDAGEESASTAPGPDVGPLGSEAAGRPEERDLGTGLPAYQSPEEREDGPDEAPRTGQEPPEAPVGGEPEDETPEAPVDEAPEEADREASAEPASVEEAPAPDAGEDTPEPSAEEAPGEASAEEVGTAEPSAAAGGEAAPADATGAAGVDYELYASEGDAGRGFRVRRSPGGHPIPWRSLPLEEGFLALEVADVDRHLDVAQLAEFAPGEAVRLVRESGSGGKSTQAPPRVAVYDASREYRVGYVPEEQSELVAELIRADPGYRGLVLWEDLEDGQVVGLRVLITASDASIRLPGPASG